MNCIFLRRGYPEPVKIAVNVVEDTASGGQGGHASYCYAIINGTKVYEEGTFEISPGATIEFGVRGYSNNMIGSVTINGTIVHSVTSATVSTYSWTVPDNISQIEIVLRFNASDWNFGRITVTTS